MPSPAYVGRFAPSPTGPLHAGSLVAALASWLDARAHGGAWRVRMEDVDTPRCVAGAADTILAQLAACGLHADGPVLFQSTRSSAYQAALERLHAQGVAYPCACTRAEIAALRARQGHAPQRHGEMVYPGTCRPDQGGLQGRAARAWRVAVPHGDAAAWQWHDRRLGDQHQALDRDVGDFIVRRADGLWAYQLAVVVDDEHQGITDVVRGEDLADNTPRQQWLQHLLELRPLRYLHTPLVRDEHGDKLSKQTGAAAVDTGDARGALASLQGAGTVLGLPAGLPARTQGEWLAAAVAHWRWKNAGMSRPTDTPPPH